MLRLESPAVDGKSCASVCTRYRTDYRFRYCGVATRILQSARPRSGRSRRGPCAEAGTAKAERPGAALSASAFFRHKDKQTNNAAKERGGSGFSRPVTPEAMRAAREATDTIVAPSTRQCMRHVLTATPVGFTIYEVYRKLELQESNMHPSPVHVSRKVSNLLELSGKLIVLF